VIKSDATTIGLLTAIIVLVVSVSYIAYSNATNPSGPSPTAVPLISIHRIIKNGTFFIQGGQSHGYNFALPTGATNITLSGTWQTQDTVAVIEAMVMNATVFHENWENGTSMSNAALVPTNGYYYSQTGSSGLMKVNLPNISQTYHIVFFDNSKESCGIRALIQLSYLSPVPSSPID
jgi:hypothetical protein